MLLSKENQADGIKVMPSARFSRRKPRQYFGQRGLLKEGNEYICSLVVSFKKEKALLSLSMSISFVSQS